MASQQPHPLASRRSLLRGAGLVAAAGGSGLLLAACEDEDGVGSEEAAGGGSPGAMGDVDILSRALDLENVAIAAYEAGASLLRGEALALARTLLEHEQEHADALTMAIRELGGSPGRAGSAEEYARDFPELKSQEDVLHFAVEVENMGIAAYLEGLGELSTGNLRATVASVVTNEAEHLAALLGALGEDQVPQAFVRGES